MRDLPRLGGHLFHTEHVISNVQDRVEKCTYGLVSPVNARYCKWAEQRKTRGAQVNTYRVLIERKPIGASEKATRDLEMSRLTNT